MRYTILISLILISVFGFSQADNKPRQDQIKGLPDSIAALRASIVENKDTTISLQTQIDNIPIPNLQSVTSVNDTTTVGVVVGSEETNVSLINSGVTVNRGSIGQSTKYFEDGIFYIQGSSTNGYQIGADKLEVLGELELSGIFNNGAGNFLVESSGNVGFRTVANVVSDLNAVTYSATTKTFTGTGLTTFDGKVEAVEATADNQIPTLGQVKTLIDNVNDSLYLGKAYQGGYIFALNGDSTSGLIAYETSLSGSFPWDNSAGGTTGATGTGLYTGTSNTTAIISTLGTAAEAATLCNDFVLGIYDDWVMPSKDETDSIYTILHLNGIGSYVSTSGYVHWTSTEATSTTAYIQYFYDGVKTTSGKGFTGAKNVIPIRSFTVGTDAAGVNSITAAEGLTANQASGAVTLTLALSELSNKGAVDSDDQIAGVIDGVQGTISGSALATFLGTGASNLSTTYNATNVTINNDNGDNAAINAATSSILGVVSVDGTTIAVDANGEISAIGGGGDEAFQTLTSGTTVTWNFDTSKNANLTIGHNVGTVTISNHDNGELGELWVTPHATIDYTINFGSKYFCNDHSNTFTIEAGSGTIYVFTLKYNGALTRVDYATYTN